MRNRFILKLKLDGLLSKGSGRQLWWLLGATFTVVAIAILCVYLFFSDSEIVWEDIIATFIDPGYNPGPGSHYWFRLILSLLSTFIFSALLISVFTNIFENISEAVREGRRRYRLEGHTIVFGSGIYLEKVVRELLARGRTVVVMSEKDPGIEGAIYYNGSQDSEEDVLSTGAEKAEDIYIIGEDDSPRHDELNLLTLKYLKNACGSGVHVFVTIKDSTTAEVFQYTRKCEEGLSVDIVDDLEYQAEQLLLSDSFLPIIKRGEDAAAHFFIIGASPAARATARMIAHICHYPSFTQYGRRTKITFIAQGAADLMNNLASSRPYLFEHSRYRYIAPDGSIQEHIPSSDKDFLDIEWQFADFAENTPEARKMMSEAALSERTRVIVCKENPSEATDSVLHLPEEVYTNAKAAILLGGSKEMIDRAAATGMYGDITVFGLAADTISDPLLERRVQLGKRVNRIYNNAYGNPPASDAEKAWGKLKEADKFSSIYCACALPLRKLCYDLEGDRLPLYEAEHRRWMMSEFLMGFRPGAATDKKKFVHADIIPFCDLPEAEKEKDKILVDAIEEILS